MAVKTGDDKTADEATDETPKPMTAEDVARIVNAAITSHNKRFESKVAELIASAVKPPEKTEEKTSDKSDPNSARIAKLEADLLAERKRSEDERKEREAERAKALRAEQAAALSTALRDAGVTDKTMAKAAQALLEADGSVTRDDSGAIKFKTVDKYGTDVFLDLSEGLSGWVKTDGQAFLPPRKTGGSGQTPPKNGSAGGSAKPDAKSEAIAEAREIFQGFIVGDG